VITDYQMNEAFLLIDFDYQPVSGDHFGLGLT